MILFECCGMHDHKAMLVVLNIVIWPNLHKAINAENDF